MRFSLRVGVVAMLTLQAMAWGGEVEMVAKFGAPGVTITGVEQGKTAKGASKSMAGIVINARDEEGNGFRKVVFEPTLPQAGYYEVWAKWPTIYWPMAAKGMPIFVTHAGGEEAFQGRPQLGGNWAFLGTYEFGATGARVAVTNEGVISMAAIDAVKFVAAEKPAQKRGARPLAAAKDDFERMRDLWLEVATGPSWLDETDGEIREMFLDSDQMAHFFWVSMDKSPKRTRLWNDMNPPTNDYNAGGREVGESFDRLRRMALAYAGAAPHYGYGAKMRGNAELKKDILEAFTWLLENTWNEQTKPGALGWLVQGAFIPRFGSETLLALGEVPEETKTRFLATAKRLSPTPLVHTGANRLFWCTGHVAMGILDKDGERIKLAREGLNEPLTLVQRSAADAQKKQDSGRYDGIYADGSFVQHRNIPYNHGYGTGMVKNLSELLQLFEGSAWEVPAEYKARLCQYVWDGVEPLSWRGQFFRRVTGRAVSSVKDELPTIESNLLAVSMIAPEPDRTQMRGLLKAILEDPAVKGYREEREAKQARAFGKKLPQIDFVRRATLLGIEKDKTLAARPWLVRSHVYYNMDMVTHVRENFAAALAMSSTRMCTHESFFSNNKRGWYQGDGHLMVHTLDYRNFLEEYWPTHNPYRLPGTTVDTQVRKDGDAGGANTGKTSTSDFAGGAEIGRKFSVAGMILHAQESTLKAKKAWFFVDDEIVCLGTGITSTDGRSIETIVEQAKINEKGDNALTVDGKEQPTNLGWTARLDKPRWVHLAGNVAGSDVGYFFPAGGTVEALREARTGAWTDIGPTSKNDPTKFTRNYVALWFDHGSNPTDGAYQYVLLPGKSAAETAAYAAKPSVEIVENTPEVSAVRDGKAGFAGAVFWGATGAQAGEIASDKAACVVVMETAVELRIGVSDPTQKQKGAITVKLARKAGGVVRADKGVKAEVSGEGVVLVVEVAGTDGKTMEAVFRK